TVGTSNAEYLRHYGVSPERLFFAPHFVDNDFFATAADAARHQPGGARTRFGIAPGAVVFLFAGKFTAKKRPVDLLEALARLRAANVDANGLFVGDGPLRAQLEQRARELGAPVVFTGFMNQGEIAAAYAAADCLVLPSDGGETWGLVVNEAMACGVPAIVSDAVGCAPDLIDEESTGFTFPLGDIKALAQRIARANELAKAGFNFRPRLECKLARYSV